MRRRADTMAWAAWFVAIAAFAWPAGTVSQTVYAAVWGDPRFVVGSSTLNSGLFRSTDAGRSWTHLGARNLKAFSVASVDRERGRNLYIAAGNGVHRSLDSGISWKIVTDWRMTEVLDIAIDQREPAWILAATAFGFWRSWDGGETWERPEGDLKQRYVRSLHAADGVITASADGPHPDAPADQFVSRDRGATWSRLQSIQVPWYIRVDSSTVALSIVGVDRDTLAGTWVAGVLRRQGADWVPSGLEGTQVWKLVVTAY